MDLVQPPPLYPPILSKALHLDKSENYLEIVRIKKELRHKTQASCYYFEKVTANVERYSDQVKQKKKEAVDSWQPVWNRLPTELKYFYEKEEKIIKKKRRADAAIKPNLIKRKTMKVDLNKLVSMEKMDDNENDETDMADKEGEKKSTKGSDEEEDNLEDEDNGDEEEMEETDYCDAYFDNGENYGDDDGGGDDDDGATY